MGRIHNRKHHCRDSLSGYAWCRRLRLLLLSDLWVHSSNLRFLMSLTYAPRVESSERQVLILLFCVLIFIFASTFAHLVIVALPDAQTAGAVATLLLAMAMIFNGSVSNLHL